MQSTLTIKRRYKKKPQEREEWQQLDAMSDGEEGETR